MRRWMVLVVLVVGVLAAPPAHAASSRDEARFLALTNSARHDAHVGALRTSADLVRFARHHTDEMARSGKLYHSSDLRTGVHDWQSVGENVGRGGSVDQVQRLFMQSKAHRANILDRRYTQVGIGVTWRGRTLYVTVVFREPRRNAAPRPTTTTTSTTTTTTAPPRSSPLPTLPPLRA